MSYVNLNGSIRKVMGSSNANRLRKEGLIPSVIYGENGDENIFFSISKKDFDKEYLKGGIYMKRFEIDIDGHKYKVLPYQIDIDPVSDLPIHIDFINIEGKKEVKTYIPINYIGADRAPGVKKGGYFNVLRRTIRFFVNPMDIPEKIDVDVSKLHIGKNIKINDITIPKNVKIVEKDNFVLCSVTGRGKSEEISTTTATTTTNATSTTTNATNTSTDANTKQTDVKKEEKKK